MRIGKFAEQNGLSIDTLRHYMELGLLFPEKKGGQYDFDESCQHDLENVLELKEMGFSLNEIKIIKTFNSLGILSPYEENAHYQALFREKSRKTQQEIDILLQAKEKLDSKIDTYNKKTAQKAVSLGVALKNLDFLICLNCGEELSLENGTIHKNQVMDGELVCRCGGNYLIESGILIAGNPVEWGSIGEGDVYEYILQTDKEYLENIQRGLQLIKRRIEGMDLEGKAILELGTGIGFLLRTIYGELPDNCVYIAVDHDLEKLKLVRSMLGNTGIRKNILFICTDFSGIPVKAGTVDVILDHAGTSNYSFGESEFLLRKIDHLTSREASLIGTYIIFKNFSINSKVPPGFRRLFKQENIRSELEWLGFAIQEEKESNFVQKGGPHENYFVQGEKVYSYMCVAKR
ncbi:MerR family transcriptional regulator [Bacillus sp. REN3]|uniref:MerR family transcriptional regulator n=1 Tax=Bacillus sp. REN3 TaxID=2802440 RepID=UPI001AEDECB9